MKWFSQIKRKIFLPSPPPTAKRKEKKIDSKLVRKMKKERRKNGKIKRKEEKIVKYKKIPLNFSKDL